MSGDNLTRDQVRVGWGGGGRGAGGHDSTSVFLSLYKETVRTWIFHVKI